MHFISIIDSNTRFIMPNQLIIKQNIRDMASSFKAPSFNAQSFFQQHQLQGSLSVIDFQWRFAVTTKHSLTKHSDCLIQLKLVLANSSSSSIEKKSKIVHLQLTMKEFNEFYREMQKISNTLAIIN